MTGSPATERSGKRTLPAFFRSLSALRALNVAAVGLSLAAVTAAIFAEFPKESAFGSSGIFAGLPTLVFGVVWALVLRARTTLGKSSVRAGWLASLPLAIANGAVACGLLFASDTHAYDSVLSQFVLGAVLGATFGAMFWVPGLIATLVCFGIPVAWSQKLAEKGLAGEERGERVVGIASAVFAIVGLLLLLRGNAPDAESSWDILIGYVLSWLFAIGGATSGAVAAAVAHRREARRKRFVAEVEAGAAPGYRIDASPEGKVLVRVTSMGQGYRVANFEEEVFELDERGEAKQALSLER